MTDATRTNPAAPPFDRSRPPGPGPRRPFNFPAIERFDLPNGLPVLTARTKGPPVATVGLILPAAGVHEPADRAGLASLTGALLESGTASRSAAEIAEAFEALGVQFGVGTGWDATHVEMTALVSRLEAGTELAADVVRSPAFPGDEVDRVRKEHIAAILQRRAEPRGLANEAAASFIFAASSPFSRPLGGTAGTLQGLTREDVAAFHGDRYTPHGSAVIIAGNLDPADARGLAQSAFGDWAGRAHAGVTASTEPASRGGQVVIVDRPGSVQSEIRVGHVAVDRSTPDYFPIVVMNTILGGAFTSRLNMSLREKHGFTYGVSSGFSMRRHAGPFVVSTAVQTEVTAAALTEILREMEGIRTAPVEQRELDDARNYVAGVFPLRLQTTEGVASRLAELAMYNLPPDYFDDYRDRILAVDMESIQRVAQAYIRPAESAVVIVGDAATVRESIEALDIAPIRILDVKELP